MKIPPLRLLLLLLSATTLTLSSQTRVDIKFKQNPVFGVSTNDVNATFAGTALTIGADVVITGGSGVYTYRWYQGEKVIGTDGTLSVEAPGDYFLDVRDQCDCLQTVVFHVLLASSVDGLWSDDATQTTVFDSQGRLVKVINGSSLDSSQLPGGVYIINRTDRNGKVSTRKITISQ